MSNRRIDIHGEDLFMAIFLWALFVGFMVFVAVMKYNPEVWTPIPYCMMYSVLILGFSWSWRALYVPWDI